MATPNFALSMIHHDYHLPLNNTSNTNNKETVVTENEAVESKTVQDPQCFICDGQIQGRSYCLATCKTQSTRSKVIEKLGELVGERSCANLLNTVDRLESEMRNVQSSILKFLEKKYSLEEGELVGNSDRKHPYQPPQITKSTLPNTSKKRSNTVDYSLEENKSKKMHTWIQCDKCKYTTQHNSFMIHHIRDHMKQNAVCDKCGTVFSGKDQFTTHNCPPSNLQDNVDIYEKNKEVHQLANLEQSMNTLKEKTVHQGLPILSVQYPQSQLSSNNENIPLIQLTSPNNLQFQQILTSDDNSLTNEPVYLRVLQHVNINEGMSNPTIISSPNSSNDIPVKIKDNTNKQLLTFTKDGNLEMLEVTWNNDQLLESVSGVPF
ncbi:uncharacterized protein pzg isoform X2 [Prorops nasuta]|uniref:uncharacterized protein pzg isoform X2 n=1 Tax=Prorops nasuta TaxID=863751 RepID=UPI0034CE583D